MARQLSTLTTASVVIAIAFTTIKVSTNQFALCCIQLAFQQNSTLHKIQKERSKLVKIFVSRTTSAQISIGMSKVTLFGVNLTMSMETLDKESTSIPTVR